MRSARIALVDEAAQAFGGGGQVRGQRQDRRPFLAATAGFELAGGFGQFDRTDHARGALDLVRLAGERRQVAGFARDGLAAWLDEQGVAYEPFGDLFDIARSLA